MASKKINVVLACQYKVMCLGIGQYIESHPKYKIVGHAESLDDLKRELVEQKADIALVELSLLKPSGLSAIKQLLKADPAIRVIVLAHNEKQPFISRCIDNGALGYVSMMCEPQEILDAIDTVYHDEKYLSKDVAYSFAMDSISGNNPSLSDLTSREYQVLTQLAQGVTVANIGRGLNLSPKTIHVYRANIYSKLGIDSLPELTLLALKYGLITLDVL